MCNSILILVWGLLLLIHTCRALGLFKSSSGCALVFFSNKYWSNKEHCFSYIYFSNLLLFLLQLGANFKNLLVVVSTVILLSVPIRTKGNVLSALHSLFWCLCVHLTYLLMLVWDFLLFFFLTDKSRNLNKSWSGISHNACC